MSTIVTRSGKGSPLTHVEVDANFTNLNTDKYQEGSAIGAVTPAAGTFTTLTANTTNIQNTGANSGLTMLRNSDSANNSTRIFLDASGGVASIYNNANTIRFQTGATIGTSSGALQLNVSHTASAVNYVQVTGAATTASPTIDAAGSDATLALTLRGKGSNGSVTLGTTFGTNFRAVGYSGATVVNYLQAQAAATTLSPVLSVAGSDTNISQVFQSKGTGAIDLAAGSSGVNISNGGTVTAITRTVIGSGYTSSPTWSASAPTTAGGVQATGTTLIGFIGALTSIASGGTGYTVGDTLTVVGGTSTFPAQLLVNAVSGGVITGFGIPNSGNYTVAPTSPVSVTGGTGSGATFAHTGLGVVVLSIGNAGSGYVEQPTVSFSGGGGSGAAAYATVGSGTTVKSLGATLDVSVDNTSSQAFRFYNSGGTGTAYWSAASGSTSPFLYAQGATNVTGRITSSGTGSVALYTGGGAQLQLNVAHTASAVNYVQVTGAATTLFPNISAQGSDSNIGLTFASKGSQSIRFNTNSTDQQFRITHTGSAVNYVQVSGNIAGSSPRVLAEGSDTNIDLTLTPKGTGNVRFGTYTADMTLVVQGYITIKDSGGTVRKLAVIA